MHGKTTWLYLSILAAFAFCCLQATALAQAFQSLSPYGESLFEEKSKAYPDFNEEKAMTEAAERFKTIKKGEQATIVLKGRAISGSFQGIEDNAILLDNQRISLLEIPAETLTRFDELQAKERQLAFIRNARESYQLEKMRNQEKTRSDLMLKYPAIDERRLANLFAKVEPQRRLTLMNEFAQTYGESLPTNSLQQNLFDNCIQKTLKAHPDLELDGAQILSTQAIAEARRKGKEAAAKKEERLASRSLQPKVATP